MTDYTELVKALRSCDEYAFCNDCPIFETCDGDVDKAMAIAADAIETLNRLVDLNTERCEGLREQLRKAQEQYEKHLNELEQKMPKRGEWVEDATTYAGPGLSNYKCSLCGKICGTWRRGLEPSELPNWCGNCGAKMEVQDERTD